MAVIDDIGESCQLRGEWVGGWIGVGGCVVCVEGAFRCEEVAWVLCALVVGAGEDVDVVAYGVIKEVEGVFVGVALKVAYMTAGEVFCSMSVSRLWWRLCGQES